MATNPIPAAFDVDKLKQIIGTVTGVAAEIEQLLAAAGIGGSFSSPQVQQLTALFGNLAAVAIQAAHDALGREITPESVLALMPVATPLVQPTN